MTSPPPSAGEARISTGVEGLDDILRGGLTADRLYLLEGTPGTGKTTFALRFLLAGAARGEPGLYITLSETAAELRAVVASHGWSLDGIEVFELLEEAGREADAEQSILYPSEVELGETVRKITARIEAAAPTRVVFDSLSEMRLLAQDPLRYRRQVLALKQFFATRPVSRTKSCLPPWNFWPRILTTRSCRLSVPYSCTFCSRLMTPCEMLWSCRSPGSDVLSSSSSTVHERFAKKCFSARIWRR